MGREETFFSAHVIITNDIFPTSLGSPQRSGKNIIRIFSASCVLYNKTERIQGIFICKIYRVASFEVLKMSSTAKTTLLSSPPPDKGQIQNKNVPLLVDIMLLEQNTIKFLSPPARMETASVAWEKPLPVKDDWKTERTRKKIAVWDRITC